MEILTVTAYTLKDILASVCIFTVMYFIFGHTFDTERLKKLGTVFGLLFLLNCALCIHFLFVSPEDIRALLDFISHILQIIVFFVFSCERKIIKSIVSVTVILFTADMIYALFVPYFPDEILYESVADIVVFSTFSVGLYFFSKRHGENFLSSVLGEIPRFVYVVLLLFELTCFYKEFGAAPSWYNVLYIISTLGITVTLFYMLFKVLFVSLQKNRIYQQILTERNYNEKLLCADEELRRFRHDYKNHLIVLNSYLENGKTQEAKKYIEAMNEPVSKLMQKASSGNFTFDAILDYKIHKAAQKGITVNFHGSVPENGIRAEDICTIFSNLLDNATEAVENSEENKTVTVDAVINKGYFVLSISNPVRKTETKKEGETSKADKKNHGLGLVNVKRCIKKYDGNLSFSCVNEMYTVDVRIKI